MEHVEARLAFERARNKSDAAWAEMKAASRRFDEAQEALRRARARLGEATHFSTGFEQDEKVDQD